jgi:hypothetical protein
MQKSGGTKTISGDFRVFLSGAVAPEFFRGRRNLALCHQRFPEERGTVDDSKGHDLGLVSRRDALRRGAIIGGAVWSVPVIQSLSAPAHAGSPAPGAGGSDGEAVGCTGNFKINMHASAPGVCGAFLGGYVCTTGTGGDFQDGCSYVVSSALNANGTWTVVLAEECQILQAFSVCGYRCGYSTVRGNAVTFLPCPTEQAGEGAAITGVQLLFCA